MRLRILTATLSMLMLLFASGASASQLDGVSCSSGGDCMAVGDAGSTPLIEHWHGSSWTAQAAPGLSAQTSKLGGVSCRSQTFCMAVGTYEPSTNTNELTLAEVWNGSSWSVLSTPNAPGAGGSYNNVFTGVSCTSGTFCIAVGRSIDASGQDEPLAEVWNGSSWSIQTTVPNAGSGFNGVSCSSTTACTAVGVATGGAGFVTFAERWNGSSWSIQSTPNSPVYSTDDDLEGVSCTSATACTAVGVTATGIGNPLGPQESFNGYSMLAERWNGRSWSIQPTPIASTSSGFNGVSCTSATACTGVGGFVNSSNINATLAERWNGLAWSQQSTPNPPGGVNNDFFGASCPSSTVCVAVGTTDAGGSGPLAERWNGSSWSIQTTPG